MNLLAIALLLGSPGQAMTVDSAAAVLPSYPLEETAEVAGLRAERAPVSAAETQGAASLRSLDRAVRVLALRVDPAELRQVLADPARLQLLAHDALFLANPDTRNVRLWDPSYRRWDPRTQSFRLSAVEKGQAMRLFFAMEEQNRRPEGRPARQATVAALVEAFLRASPGKIFQAHWDNQDDTAFDGLISVDDRTGELRVLMTHDFA